MTAIRLLAVLVCLSVLGVAQQRAPESQAGTAQTKKQTRAEATASPAQQEILQASERLRQAMLNSDPDELRQVLAVNYTGVDLMGRRLDRAATVEVIAFRPLRFDKVDIETQSIQVGASEAVQSGSAYIQGTHNGELFNSTYRFTRQWQRQDGQWKLVSTQIHGVGGTL